ncbi:ATP-grasp domain-containing protein [Nonomuraea antimicrobica]|uniref:ATP-grasp domain-containing protein n=1 Tax=Nonomuraea antimicrobica TaxID=561173 RepID=A0ABP7C6U2_9ACTN
MSRERLLFVESNTTGTGMLALGTAARLGYEPVFLTADPSRYAGLERTGARVVRCDTGSAGSLREAATGPISGPISGPIAGVTTTSEFYLAATAALAQELGLPGNPADVVRTCRDKAAVRLRLDRAGIPQPRWRCARSVDEVPEAVAAVGLPCVVKPVDDSGSANVRVCASVREAADQARVVLAVRRNVRGQPTAGTVLIEEYVAGPEYSVEMFSHRGEARCVGVTRKTVGAPPYCVELGHLHPAGLTPAEESALVETVRAVLGALGVMTGPTHTEVKVGAIIEVNCRLAGGMIPELVRLARGVDLLEQQLRCAVGEPPDLDARAGGYAGIHFITAGRAGTLRGVAGLERVARHPGIAQVTVTARRGAEVRPPRTAYDRLGFVIAAGDSPSAVTSALSSAARTVVPLLTATEPTTEPAAEPAAEPTSEPTSEPTTSIA